MSKQIEEIISSQFIKLDFSQSEKCSLFILLFKVHWFFLTSYAHKWLLSARKTTGVCRPTCIRCKCLKLPWFCTWLCFCGFQHGGS